MPYRPITSYFKPWLLRSWLGPQKMLHLLTLCCMIVMKLLMHFKVYFCIIVVVNVNVFCMLVDDMETVCMSRLKSWTCLCKK